MCGGTLFGDIVIAIIMATPIQAGKAQQWPIQSANSSTDLCTDSYQTSDFRSIPGGRSKELLLRP